MFASIVHKSGHPAADVDGIYDMKSFVLFSWLLYCSWRIIIRLFSEVCGAPLHAKGC